MITWKSFLKNDSINWLLENNNPSVRYLTLMDILNKSNKNSEVIESKKKIMESGLIQKILSKQNSKGYWFEPENFYIKRKYKGTVWNLIILAEIGADGNDKRIKKACEFILNNSQNKESGGFAYSALKSGGGADSKVLPCLSGNMVWSLICFGYIDDFRVQKGIEWITNYQRFDDGIQELPENWPYKKHINCFGKHSCHMGVVKSLKALAEIPEEKRSKIVKITIKNGVEYLLKHHIYKKSHDLNKVSKPSWLQLSFPHMYQTDILEILDILTRLWNKDRRMQDAIDILISKQNENGTWNLERTFNGRFITNIETKGKPSKWITLNALRVLKRYYI
ncbi:MAG: nitrogen fixation protein NifH [Thermoplasmatales archaeon SG8-52-3]|nr:MAG: nitrogen fixation protein NifH [Thermoplasmatales archaeon SG8-52-3]